MSVLQLDGVVRRFGDVTAVDGVDLTVEPGEVVGLLGHNGAGKTTIVRMLAGLLAPTAGHVSVLGLSPSADGPAVRAQLGVLPASPIVDRRMTAAANLRFAADLHGMPVDGLDEHIATVLAGFELADRADAVVDGFSTGMRQRLSLARVLLPDPAVLLLDEPTAALDPVAARNVRRLIAGLAQREDRTVLLCTHDLAEAEELCDRVVVLQHGRVLTQGAPAELTAQHGAGGLRVEVAAERVEQAAGLLEELAGDVTREGAGRLHATGVARDAVPGLVARLAGAGIDVYEVRREDPTLEDVYLALHGGEVAA